MLVHLYPRHHRRFSSLPLLGSYVDDFIAWLRDEGYPRVPICRRMQQLPRVDRALRRRGIRSVRGLSGALLIALSPKDSQDHAYFTATVRSLARFFAARGLLGPPPPKTRSDKLIDEYRQHLVQVRGLAATTIAHHASTARELLAFLRYEGQPRVLQRLDSRRIEAFLTRAAPRFCREGLQHVVAHVRSLLRFLVGKGCHRPGSRDRYRHAAHLPRRAPATFAAVADGSIVPRGNRSIDVDG